MGRAFGHWIGEVVGSVGHWIGGVVIVVEVAKGGGFEGAEWG
jgi:hypothetical protein